MERRYGSGIAWRGLAFALGLALTPCAALLLARLLPEVAMSEGWSNAVAFGGGALLAVLGLALTASYEARLLFTALVALASSGVLLGLTFTSARVMSPLTAAALVDTALVALAWGLGVSTGRRVQHPSHVLPACVVAASADLVSVLSPEGPSHAIAQSDRALSVLATWFPVPGTHAWAPALGIGDLLFMGLIFGVAQRHALPPLRTVLACVLGVASAGALSALFGVAVPALPSIGACVLVALPAARRVRPADRRAAYFGMLLACSIAAATILRNFVTRG